MKPKEVMDRLRKISTRVAPNDRAVLLLAAGMLDRCVNHDGNLPKFVGDRRGGHIQFNNLVWRTEGQLKKRGA